MRGILREALQCSCLGLMLISLMAPPLPAAGRRPENRVATAGSHQQDWDVALTEDQKILQLLDRVTFGPREVGSVFPGFEVSAARFRGFLA